MFLVIVLICLTVYLAIYVFNVLSKSSGSEFEDNSIDAFIVEDNGVDTPGLPTTERSKYKQDYCVEGRQILLLFGTEYGCSEEVAKLLYDRLIGKAQD